jgi:co-chaperonin GroES (HSP10)
MEKRAMPYMEMDHEIDPRTKILDEIKSLDGVEIYNNQVLLAVYMRPTKTKTGIILTDQYVGEDLYQSKVGLVLMKGPSAFVEKEELWFKDVNVNEGDWVMFRPSDGWQININGTKCRIMDDIHIRGKITNPDNVW